MMKIMYKVLMGIHLFVGFGAILGGLAAVTNPIAPLGIPTSALKNSPFSDFLIPGITLICVIGFGNLLAAGLGFSKQKFQGYISGSIGVILMGWIVIQCIMLQAIAALHVIFFLIGMIQGLMALTLLWEKSYFPTNLLKNMIKFR